MPLEVAPHPPPSRPEILRPQHVVQRNELPLTKPAPKKRSVPAPVSVPTPVAPGPTQKGTTPSPPPSAPRKPEQTRAPREPVRETRGADKPPVPKRPAPAPREPVREQAKETVTTPERAAAVKPATPKRPVVERPPVQAPPSVAPPARSQPKPAPPKTAKAPQPAPAAHPPRGAEEQFGHHVATAQGTRTQASMRPSKTRVIGAMLIDGAIAGVPAVLLALALADAPNVPWPIAAVGGIILSPMSLVALVVIAVAISLVQHTVVFSALRATVGGRLFGVTWRANKGTAAPARPRLILRGILSPIFALLFLVGPFYAFWLSAESRGPADGLTGLFPQRLGAA